MKVLVKEAGAPARVLTLGPAGQSAPAPNAEQADGAAPWVNGLNGSQARSLDEPQAPGVRPMATIGSGDTAIDTTAVDARRNSAGGWALTEWAIKSCVPKPNADGVIEGTPFSTAAGLGIAGAPWVVRAVAPLSHYYFFYWRTADDYTRVCDTSLFMQETLLCAADRLAQLVDSPGTVTWDVPQIRVADDADPSTEADAALTVTIPPQSAEDLFIAREMAFNVLAHINALDARPILPSNTVGSTCGRQWARMAQAGSNAEYELPTSSFYFDPEPIDFAEASPQVFVEASVRRLKRKAMMLASSARLTQRLLEGSVEQDLAGAQQFLTQGGTSQSAARRAWGVEEGQSPANTLRHAVKTLFGRLEIGNHLDPTVHAVRSPYFRGESQFLWDAHEAMRDDPRCNGAVLDDGEEGSGFLANDSLFAMGGGTSARWQDVPPSSPQEAYALSLLDGAGIILPPSLELSDASLSGTGSVLVAELVRQAAMRAKPADVTSEANIATFVSTYRASEFGLALKKGLAEIPPSAWRFAAGRSYGAFRLLTQSPPVTDSDAPSTLAALKDASAAAGVPLLTGAIGIEALGGVVVSGGLHRDALSTDVMSLLGAAQHNANCGAHSFPYDTLSRNSELAPRGNDVMGFQNAFLLGLSLERQLADLARQARARSADVPTLSPVAQFAAAAAAEAREWAGPGWMTRFTTPRSETDPEDLPANYSVVELVNLKLSDIGLETEQDVIDRFVLVRQDSSAVGFPSPILADCVAGLRRFCPTLVETPSTVLTAKYVQVDPEPLGRQEGSGVHEPIIRIKFATESVRARFAVIRAKDGQTGRVLGVLPGTSTSSDRFVEVVSHRQRELANRVFGLVQNKDIDRTCSDVPPLSMPAEYCVRGMQREQFVPLANSITSMSGAVEDSFKHYLDVAEQNAARADELGRQLIELGLQRDVRSEAASEAVSQICGAYPNDANLLDFSDGTPKADVEDSAIEACMSPEKIDVVYLRKDLAAGKEPDAICAAFCGGGRALAPFCSRKCKDGAHLEGAKDISTAGLDLLSDAPGLPKGIEACAPVATTFTRGPAGSRGSVDLSALETSLEDGTVSNTSVALALGGLRLDEREDGQWALLSNGRPIMGSLTLVQSLLGGPDASLQDVWPLCGADCSERATLLGTVFHVANDDNVARYPKLRREVERALFFMGAMAGYLPEGVFQVPLPVIDRDRVEGEIASPAFYAPGRYESSGGRYQAVEGHYLGVKPYPLAASQAMGKINLPGNGVVNFITDRQATQTGWRRELFAAAQLWRNADPAGVLMTEPIGNAALHFDELLDPEDASSTRDQLGQWLRRIYSRYEQRDLSAFDVQKATFYRAKNPEDVPMHFCASKGQDGEFFEGGGQELMRGRQVCTGAPVSPIFYATSPAFDQVRVPLLDSCFNTALPDHLFSTHRARAVDKGKPTDEAGGWEIGWFRLLPAVQIERRDDCEVDGDDYCTDADEDGFSWSQVVSTQCPGQKLWTIGKNTPDAACEHYDGFYKGKKFNYGSTAMIPHDRLRPDVCSPAERVELFIESDVIETDGDRLDPSHAVQVLTNALTLACATGRTELNPALPPPQVKTVEDMLYLEAWTAGYAQSVWQTASYLYLVDVPVAALDAIQNGGANTAAVVQGDQGQILLELEKNVRMIESSIASMGVELSNLSRAVGEARVGIQGIELEAKGTSLELRLSRVEYARQAAVAEAEKAKEGIAAALGAISTAGSCVASFGVGCIHAIVELGQRTPVLYEFVGIDNPNDINAEAAKRAQGIVSEQAQTNTELKNNRIQQALIAMNRSMENTQQLISGHLTSLENSVSSSLQEIGKIQQSQSAAQIAMAKASGADFVQLGVQDRLVPLHVNTVYRRQFDVTLQRYHAALDSAKRAAYLARLALEERLGVRLDDLYESVGPLEAPALWADNLCTVQGVNYSALREALPTDETDRDAKELDLIHGFANQYVGDYVAQLREFVEFYNLQFPFANGQDVALVSLRSDVQDPGERCVGPSPNLLFYSDQLQFSGPDLVRGPNPTYGGWNVTGCDADRCVVASPGGALAASTMANSPLLAAPTPGGVSWLYTRTRSPEKVVSDDETGTTTNDREPILIGRPSGYVFQTIDLEVGREYALSWWDQARSSDGSALSMDTTAPARAAVFDADWNIVALESFEPAPSWSRRRALRLVPPASGPYHVAFSPALDGREGSVAIANVQVEQVARGLGAPEPYASNAGSRMRLSSSCTTDPATFQARFEYKCGDDGCWHVLRDPLIVDVEAINQGGSSLVGKVAQGNFNHRLAGVAVNVVGTGLRDCAGQDQSCYGTGYAEYDLQHEAFNVPLEDYSNHVRCFDFGRGTIHNAKALATERFLTIPLGATDKEIVNSSPFLKTELAGRPLSGTYRLRIKDSPGLVWSALEDVQLVINYDYWSRVDIARNP